jgi:Domain of unknown function DUF302
MLFWQLDLDVALTLDPQAAAQHGRRLVRVIAGNPVTMGQMTRHLPDAGSYAPVTILVAETPGGGTRVSYDSVASVLAPYRDQAAAQVARHLDDEVLTLLRPRDPDSRPVTGGPVPDREAPTDSAPVGPTPPLVEAVGRPRRKSRAGAYALTAVDVPLSVFVDVRVGQSHTDLLEHAH